MATKGARDGDFKDVSALKKNVRCYEDETPKNEAVGKKERGVPPVVGKLGK